MITIFSTPRAFRGPFNRIQRNAITSWLKLSPKCEIILFEDEEKTTSKVAKEFGLRCIKNVKKNEYGSLIISDVFAKAKKLATHNILAYVNTDIILTDSFIKAIKRVHFPEFFMVGQRWNLDHISLNFNKPDWQPVLYRQIKEKGVLHPPTGMDYWIFHKNTDFKMPPFIVGRPCVDSWLVYKSRFMKIPVINSTRAITIVHQNHPTPKKLGPMADRTWLLEKETNLKLGGGQANMFTLADADWILTPKALKKARPTIKQLFRYIISIFILHPKSGYIHGPLLFSIKKIKLTPTSKRIIALAILLLFVARMKTAMPYLKSFSQEMIGIFTDKRNYSYDQKMAEINGFPYIFLKHVNDATPQESDIIFPPTPPHQGLRPILAAYYLYPRSVTVMDQSLKLNTPPSRFYIDKNFPRYILMINGFPDFPVKANRIYLFGDKLDDPVAVVSDQNYNPDNADYKNKLGIIKL